MKYVLAEELSGPFFFFGNSIVNSVAKGGEKARGPGKGCGSWKQSEFL